MRGFFWRYFPRLCVRLATLREFVMRTKKCNFCKYNQETGYGGRYCSITKMGVFNDNKACKRFRTDKGG